MKVASFYRFLDLCEPQEFAAELLAICQDQALLGTILVATEGINGSVSGSEADIRLVMRWIEQRLRLDVPLEARWNETAEAPFRRMRVRQKKEIVALGRPDLLPHKKTGRYVAAAEWNELIEKPDVLVVDTRNHYEFEVGSFPRAIDPKTDSFREFVAFAEQLASESTARPVAMFCTGGIRCEKATALMLELGFEEVYHLQGGILKYLEEVPRQDSLWDGECFVFDTRVAVDRDLTEGGYVQCHACRRPLSEADIASPDYREGVSCPKCIQELDDERAARLEERRKQVLLAAERGGTHIGPK
jgi:UPF0176 protein